MTRSAQILCLTIAANIVCLLITAQLPSFGIRAEASHLIIAAVLLSLILTYTGWFFHYRYFNQRVKVLFDNVTRIRSGQSLNPQIGSGKDTTARLGKAMVSVNTLLSEHRRALETSDQKTRTLVETVPVGIIITDDEGSILVVNPRTQALLRRSPEDLVGTKVWALFPDLPLQAPLTAEKTKDSFEVTFQLSDVRVHLEVTLREFGKSIDKTWLLSLTDISDRKQLEKLKNEFMQMITHDLRSPLTSILVYLDMLTAGKYGSLTEIGLKKAKGIEGSCDRMVGLINSLLDMEKFSTGTLALDLDSAEVSAIFERSIESLSGVIEASRVTVVVAEGTELELICDEERLVQVIINLLSNAVKYSPEGGTVTLAARTTGDGTEFSVSDQGIGIPAEHRESVFDRFYQVPEQTKEGGSGLGLAICKEIVKAHRGTLGVGTNNGIGSRFWCVIPKNPGA